MSINDRIKYKISFILLVTSLVVYISSRNWSSDTINNIPIFKNIENPDSLAKELISHWKELSIVQGNISTDFWSKNIIVFIFNMHSCSICLPRVDEIFDFVISQNDSSNYKILCVGISKNQKILNRYLLVSPKSCPVMMEELLVPKKFDYGSVPQIIIIDRREKIKVSKGLVPKTNLSEQYFSQLKLLLKN